MNKRITNIIMGLLLVLLMGVLVGCPTEAPKEKDKSGGNDPTPRVPIVINDTSGNWRTEAMGTDVRILEYTGTDKAFIKSIVIPTTVDGKKVVEIKGFTATLGVGDVGIFRQKRTEKNTNITSVDMFNATHLKTITTQAFSYMTNVASVILPEGLTTIGNRAFSFTEFTSIILPEGLTTIGNSAFGGTKLKSIIIPDSVLTIGTVAFSSSDLESVILPEGLTTIENQAFSSTKLTSIILPDRLTKIEGQAFFDTDLTSITIPASVTTIENVAFGNTKLTSVTILRNATGEANPLTNVGTNMFLGTPMADATKPSTIYYPTGTAYKTTDGWKDYKDTSTWIEGTP